MSQTTTQLGRAKLAHPDIGYDTNDGGVNLHAALVSLWTLVSNYLTSRWSGGITLADTETTTITHNFGLAIAKLKIIIFEVGSQLTAAQTTANYLITQSTTNAINVQNISGGSKTFDIVILPFRLGVTSSDIDSGFIIVSNTAYDAIDWDSVNDIAPSKNAVRDKIETMISDVAYDATSWDNVTGTAPSKNAVRDKIEAMLNSISGLVSDVAYDATSWDNVTGTAPSKNAVRDKIEAMISDLAYNATDWDGVTTVAPSKNAVRDKIESITTQLGSIAAVPIGAMIATASNLTGAYNCTATTAADSAGFVQCNGQTIVDATSPMNGAVIPNINNNVFLMGNATAGTAGGSNTKDLTHTHTMAHTHDTTITHTHTHAHTHDTTINHTHSLSVSGTLPDHTHTLTNAGGAKINAGTSAPNSQGPSALPDGPTTGWTSTCSMNNTPGWFSQAVAKSASIGLIGSTSSVTSNPSIASSGTSGGASTSTFTSGGASTSTTSNPSTSTFTSGAASNGTTSTGTLSSSYDIRPSYITAKFIMRIK